MSTITCCALYFKLNSQSVIPTTFIARACHVYGGWAPSKPRQCKRRSFNRIKTRAPFFPTSFRYNAVTNGRYTFRLTHHKLHCPFSTVPFPSTNPLLYSTLCTLREISTSAFSCPNSFQIFEFFDADPSKTVVSRVASDGSMIFPN